MAAWLGYPELHGLVLILIAVFCWLVFKVACQISDQLQDVHDRLGEVLGRSEDEEDDKHVREILDEELGLEPQPTRQRWTARWALRLNRRSG